MGILTYAEARSVYDRFGARQDTQRFYEDAAFQDLLRHGRFEEAEGILEFGCGTGRFAEVLLEAHLKPTTRYIAMDVSRTMIDLTRRRLARFGGRVELVLTDGYPRLTAPAGSCDRFLSTYVLDLLSPADICTLLAQAHALLPAGGLLALVSLTHGSTPLARLVESVWTRVHSRRPALVGGCRPIALLDFIGNARWSITHHAVVTASGISSEIAVAEPIHDRLVLRTNESNTAVAARG